MGLYGNLKIDSVVKVNCFGKEIETNSSMLSYSISFYQFSFIYYRKILNFFISILEIVEQKYKSDKDLE